MTWSAQRRLIILLIVGAVIAAFATIIGFATFYQAPSCSDGKQNQGETGIDCGGACQYLCTADERPVTVLFTKAIANGSGRTDVAASVQNSNPLAAAKDVPYTITLYGANHVFVQQVTGTIDLPPAATVPVFFPGISSGNQKVTNVFLTIAPSAPQWYTFNNDPRTLPVVANTTLVGTQNAPRVDALLTNAGVSPLSNVRVVIFVRDAQNELIAASQTIVPKIPGQGNATATFTWNASFSGIPAAIEVLPVIPLP